MRNVQSRKRKKDDLGFALKNVFNVRPMLEFNFPLIECNLDNPVRHKLYILK